MTKSQFLDQQDMPPTRITSITLNSKNELKKIIRPTRFQNRQMQFVSIFFEFVRLHLAFVFALSSSLYFQGCALHCSRAWWPLVPNFCSWASRKSYKSYAGHLGFYRFRALGSLQFFLEQSLDFLLMF